MQKIDARMPGLQCLMYAGGIRMGCAHVTPHESNTGIREREDMLGHKQSRKTRRVAREDDTRMNQDLMIQLPDIRYSYLALDDVRR
jgi:hypothetical protein